jgi:hypothetical protein
VLITVADANIGSIRDGFPPWTGDVLRSIAGNRYPAVTRRGVVGFVDRADELAEKFRK